MAAVSSSEAWNDAPQPTEARPITTVAAKATAMVNADAESKTDERDRELLLALLALIEENHAIDDEIIALRADETRRCTVYMVFGAVLFGILFMYIDRLQGRTKTLNKLLIHPHTSLRDRISAIAKQHTQKLDQSNHGLHEIGVQVRQRRVVPAQVSRTRLDLRIRRGPSSSR